MEKNEQYNLDVARLAAAFASVTAKMPTLQFNQI
jgi:hypothetical protein